MKGTKFRLAPVLRIRTMQERVAAGEAAAAATRVREAEHVAQTLEQHARQVIPLASVDGLGFVAGLVRGHRLASDAADAHGHALQAQQVAVDASAAWTTAAQQKKIMEKLAERHAAAVNAAREHAEIRAVDDLVTAAYAAKMNDEGNS